MSSHTSIEMERASENASQMSSLAPGAAFVVHLAVQDTAASQQRGWVEHVLTGNATQFESIDDLVAFMVATVASRGRACEVGRHAETLDGNTPSPPVDSS